MKQETSSEDCTVQRQCITCGFIEPPQAYSTQRRLKLEPYLCIECPCFQKRARAYLAGPISGVPDFREWFAARAEAWRAAGWHVTNPAEMQPGLEADQAIQWSFYMRRDIPHLTQAEALLLSPRYKQSHGSMLELLLAMELDIAIYDADSAPALSPHEIGFFGTFRLGIRRFARPGGRSKFEHALEYLEIPSAS